MDSKNAQQDEREVQLEGERLERTRRHVSQAHDQLRSIADIMLTAIGSERVAEDIAEIRVSLNEQDAASGARGAGANVVYFLGTDENGNTICIGTYRDPPGICTTQC
jgi:hypothetical protein